MSYSCNNCGRELNGTGDAGYCNECSRQMNDAYLDSEAKWYSRSSLCQKCNNAWGPDSCDRCDAYDMPLYMVARKKKCKRFKPYIEIGFNGG